jgi:hypothetical protein
MNWHVLAAYSFAAQVCDASKAAIIIVAGLKNYAAKLHLYFKITF